MLYYCELNLNVLMNHSMYIHPYQSSLYHACVELEAGFLILTANFYNLLLFMALLLLF